METIDLLLRCNAFPEPTFLASVVALADEPGDQRQRALVRAYQCDPVIPALAQLVRGLAADFTAGQVALVA